MCHHQVSYAYISNDVVHWGCNLCTNYGQLRCNDPKIPAWVKEEVGLVPTHHQILADNLGRDFPRVKFAKWLYEHGRLAG